MKAVVWTKYGPPDVLKVKDIEKPRPKHNEVLIKVHASSVNRTDCGFRRAKPFVARFFTGLIRPKRITPGTEFSGKIESIGKSVTRYSVGDRVFGFDDNFMGANAEYMVLPEDRAIFIIPENTTYARAAVSSEGAHYAYNFIQKVNLKKNQRVLVNGASGGIGSAAVQLLKQKEVNVTAVCSTKNIKIVKSLGPDHIIDYKKKNFTKTRDRFHFIFDAVGKSTFGACKNILLPGGIYISSELGPFGQNVLFALVSPFMSDKKVIFPIPKDPQGSVNYIAELMKQNKYTALIDKKYPMEDIVKAHRYVERGHKRGNVVITITGV